MSWLSDHAQRISDWQQRAVDRNENWVPRDWRGGSAPGSPMAAADALALNQWNRPFGDEANSFDVYFGGGSSQNPDARRIGRTVGSIAGLTTLANWASGAAGGGGSGAEAANAGEAAPTTFDSGFPGDPGAAPAGLDFSGAEALDSGFPGDPAASPGGFDVGSPTVFSPPMGGSWTSYIPSLRNIAYGSQVAGGLLGLANSWEMRKEKKRQQARQRAYQEEVDNLRRNPGSVSSMPGYQFEMDQGEEALNRRMAAMGYGGSGNLALATRLYGQNFASSKLSERLAQIAAAHGVGGGGDIQTTDPLMVAMQSLRMLGYGMGGFG